MADLTFPNLGNALLTGYQARMMGEQLGTQQRRRELAPQVQAALGGDESALSRIAGEDPEYAAKLAPLLTRLDENKRAAIKQAADYATATGMGILNADPAQRPALYTAALADLKARGTNISSWPTQYGPDAEAKIRFEVSRAIPVTKWFEEQQRAAREGTDFGPPVGGGAGSSPPANQADFVAMMMPHALEVSKATGLDPRLVIAQSALETGFGRAAPGNNYFGIKSHGQPGGQVLATTEAGPRGMYGTRESFRTYPDAGASARDYAAFLQGNERYAPVLASQGLEAQIEAMGRSGYATDPHYTAKLRQIVQSLPALGGAGVQPAIAQGDNIPSAQPAQAGGGDPYGKSQVPQGSRMAIDKRTQRPVIVDGKFLYKTPDGQWVGVPVKPGGTGIFPGNSVEANALNQLIARGILTEQQALDLAAGKTITDPSTGQIFFKRPTELVGGTPPAGAPAVPGAAPSAQPQTSGVPLTPGGPSRPEMAKYREMEAEGKTITNALNAFLDMWKGASIGDRAMSMTGATTQLNTAYNKAALLAKGEALFNLGVLNGPDLDIIRRTLPDPSTFKSGIISDKEIEGSIKQVVDLINDRLAQRAQVLGIAKPGAGQAAPAGAPAGAPAVGTVEGGYRFKGGDPSKPESWEKVQ